MSKTARLVRERVDPRLTAALFAKVDNAIDFAGSRVARWRWTSRRGRAPWCAR